MALEKQLLADRVLARLHATRRDHLKNGDLVKEFGVSQDQERTLLRRLTRGGNVIRLQRGRYLLPPLNQRSVNWSPTEALALKSLILEAGGQYQLCGPIVFQRYGWDDQIPNRVHAYNTLFSGDRRVGAVQLKLMPRGLVPQRSRLRRTGHS